MKKSIFTIAITALLVGLAACTAKKRDTALPYGEDKDLLEISKVDGQEFDVTTTKLNSVSASNRSDLKVQDETNEKNFLNFVDYKTDATLLAESPFRGKEGAKYKVRYVLESDSIKVYKLKMDEADLSFEERQSATTLKDGKIGAPVVAYRVSYYSVDNSRNELDEATHRLRLVSEQNKEKATHFKIDLNSKTLTSYLQKDIVFPSDYFDGDWYFATSVVGENYLNKQESSLHGFFDYYVRARGTKVRLKKEETKLSFYSTNVDDLIKKDLQAREENQSVLLEFPADFIDYRFSENGLGKSVKEEEYKLNSWSKRPFVKLDLAKVSLGSMNSFSGAVRDVQVSFDKTTGRKYFSFTIFNESNNIVVRYAMLQATPRKDVGAYEPKIYWREDQSIFGFYAVEKNVLQTADRNNEAFKKDASRIIRFNPKLSKIVFHPSDQTPDWTLESLQISVNAWDNAFKAAGVPTRIEFNPEKVKVGDIRYNTIHVLPDEDGFNQWGGFGPAVSDPETGEIISTSASINLANFNQAGRIYVRRYIRSQIQDNTFEYITTSIKNFSENLGSAARAVMAKDSLGRGSSETSNGLPAMTSRDSFLSGLPTNQDKNTSINLKENALVLTKSNPKGYVWQPVATKNSESSKGFDFKNFSARPMEPSTFNTLMPNIAKEIETLAECASVRSYVANAKTAGRKDAKEENDIVDTCGRALFKQHLIHTVMHELGHNFGLRHNFYGSVDKANFPVNVKNSFTSSVMEYTSSDHGAAPIAADGKSSVMGWYDIAAIRWGYSDQLFSKDMKQVLKTDSKSPLKSQESFKASRPFMYCSDEHSIAHGGPNAYDALCATADKGTTATEIVANTIASYNYSLANSFNLESGDNREVYRMFKISDARNEDFFIPITSIYHQYRMMIEEVAPGLGYLEGETVETYGKFLKDIEKKYESNPSKLAQFKDLQKASGLAYQFFKTIALMPDYYCVTRFENDPLSPIKLLGFGQLQREIFEKTNKTVQNCMEDSVRDYIQAQGGERLSEVGYPLLPMLRDLELRNDKEPLVAFGTFFERINAMTQLSARQQLLRRNRLAGFNPNFFDEPQYRQDLEKTIISRITDGVSVKSLGNNSTLSNLKMQDMNFPKFANETYVLNFTYESMLRGSIIPGKAVVNSDRMKRYKVNFAYSSQQLELPGAKPFLYAGNNYYVMPENEVVYQLVDQVNFSLNLKKSVMPSDQIIVSAHDFLYSRLPSASDKSFKVGQLANLFKDLNSQVSANQKYADVAAFIGVALSKDMNVINEKIQSYVNEQMKGLESEEAAQKKMAAIMEMSIFDILAKTNTKFDLTKERLDSLLKSALVEFKKQYDLYKTYQNDFDAQADILIQSILTGS